MCRKAHNARDRIIVYSPQIYENYSRKSGEGLSVAFVITWLLGDLFSLAGAIIAGLIPTVILLACYVSIVSQPQPSWNDTSPPVNS